MSFLNTTHSGSVRNVIFQENGEWFAVALELNIIETGDSPQEVMMLLDSAIKGYVDGTRKSGLSVGVLNQEVDPEYEALWNEVIEGNDTQHKIVYSTTVHQLAALV